MIVTLKTYFQKILSVCFLREIEICKNYLIIDNSFTCKVTNKKYHINNDFDCNCVNVIYLISCPNCNGQYIGSAIDFKNVSQYTKVILTSKRKDVDLLVISLINAGTHRILMLS